MKSAVVLREKLSARQPVLGVLVTHHLWLELIEIAIGSGLDYAILDAEHLDHGGSLMADVCRLGRMADFPILVRPADTNPTALRLAMDLGPCGLLLPMIDSAEQLDAARQSLHLPPRGQRRPGGPGNRWLDQYTYDAFRRTVEDTLVVIPQIESPQGLENVTAIAAHPLTTAVGVGPFDLSARLGVCGQMRHPTLWASIERVRKAADAVGKPMWMIGDGPTLIDQGFRFVCLAEPSAFLEASLKRLVASLRSVETPASNVDSGHENR